MSVRSWKEGGSSKLFFQNKCLVKKLSSSILLEEFKSLNCNYLKIKLCLFISYIKTNSLFVSCSFTINSSYVIKYDTIHRSNIFYSLIRTLLAFFIYHLY